MRQPRKYCNDRTPDCQSCHAATKARSICSRNARERNDGRVGPERPSSCRRLARSAVRGDGSRATRDCCGTRGTYRSHRRGPGPGLCKKRDERVPRHPLRRSAISAGSRLSLTPLDADAERNEVRQHLPADHRARCIRRPCQRHGGLSLPERLHAADREAASSPAHGESNDYDASALVKGGPAGPTVVVTINYRLGLLGYFGHPAIDGEEHDSATTD